MKFRQGWTIEWRVMAAVAGAALMLACGRGLGPHEGSSSLGLTEAGASAITDASAAPDGGLVDKSRLGPTCETGESCAADENCTVFLGFDDPELAEPRCVRLPVCDVVTCSSPNVCVVNEAIPVQVSCDR